MLVRAKYQFSYEGKAVVGNEFFDMDEKHYQTYKGDIDLVDRLPEPIVVKEIKREVTKNLKKSKVKTK